jgi:hypothetical protein
METIMPSIRREGKVTTAFDFDLILRDRLLAFAGERGTTLTHELHEAVRRHLAYPPPASVPAPLDDAPRPRARKKVAKKS